MGVRFLGQEGPLEESMATQFSILAKKVPWTEEPGELQSIGLQESDTTEQPSMQADNVVYRGIGPHQTMTPRHVSREQRRSSVHPSLPKARVA